MFKMNNFYNLLGMIWTLDYKIFFNSNLIWVFYILICCVLFLENALLIASFLPGDSLLFLLGILISKKKFSFILVLCLLTISSSIGTWLGYMQGKWLGNTVLVKKWLSYIPENYYNKACYMFNNYGLFALLSCRFIVFVRTLIPIIIGLSGGLNQWRFHILNWISAFIWVFIFLFLGYVLGTTNVLKISQTKIITFFTLLPILFLVLGFVTMLMFIKKNK